MTRIMLFLALILVALVPISSYHVSSTSRLKSSLEATFYSRHNNLYIPSWDARGLSMADPDVAPEVNPTRRDPDEPGIHSCTHALIFTFAHLLHYY